MARRDTSARRYADAAFQTGRADRALDAWERDLEAIRRLVTDPTLKRLLQHPAVAYGDKERVLRRVVGRAVAAGPLNLVLLMVRRGRSGALGPMMTRFAELLRRERGIALARVSTALPLDAAERDAIETRLRDLTGKQVEMEVVTDPGLIGGIAVRIGDRLYDASVRSRLERLRARLTAA